MLRHFIAVMLLSACAFAQGGLFQDKAEGKLINNNAVIALPGAQIQVCTDALCASPITLYSDVALTHSIGTSTTADINANYRFFATPGVYWCQETAAGFTTSLTQCQISTPSVTGTGGGTVTSVSGLSPLFVVANGTTTATFSLSQAAAHTYFGNNTGVLGTPGYFRPACADLSDAGAFCNGVAYSNLTGVPTLPATKAAVTSFWIRSYDSATGLFTTSQPAFTDLTGSAACSQEPARTGDVTSSAGSCVGTVVKINNVLLSGLTNGLLKLTAGVPSTGLASDVVALLSGLTGCGTAGNVFTPQASDCVAPGGGSLPTATSAGQTPVASGAGTTYTAQSPGLGDSPNSPITLASASYTLACPNGTNQQDNSSVVRITTSGANPVVIPLSTATNCASAVFYVINATASSETVNATSTNTLTVFGNCGSDCGTGKTTFTLASNATFTANQGASGIWEVKETSPSSTSSGTVLSKTASYTTVAADFSTAAPSAVIYSCTTANTPCTHTLPSATTGLSSAARQTVWNSCSSTNVLYILPATLTLDGSATVKIAVEPCRPVIIIFDGSNFRSDVAQPNTAAQGGMISPYGLPSSGTTSAAMLAANRAEGYAFYIPSPVTVTNFTFFVTTGTVATTGDVGLYDIGGNLITHTGSLATATSATQLKTAASTAVTLTPGLYVVAMCDSANTPTFSMMAFSSPFANVLGTNTGLIGAQQESTAGCTAGVLPSTIVWTQVNGVNGVPIVAMTP